MTIYSARMAQLMPVVRLAGELAQQHRDAGLAITAKGSQDFVTQADKAVEDYLVGALNRLFPADAVLGEEGGFNANSLTESEGTWVIDPIDGTTNYIQGMDYWCISVGYLVAGQVQLGCIYAPDRNEFFHAIRGEGCFLNGQRLTVEGPEPGAAIVGLGMSSRHPIQRYLDVIAHLISNDVEYRRFGAGALMLAHVASGQVDGYFEAHLNSWDATAGLLLVEEAGGVCCDFFADNGLQKGNPIWVAAPGLYQQQATFLLSGNQ